MARDPRRTAGEAVLADLAAPYLGRPGVEPRRMFGGDSVTVHGKIFGFVDTEGNLVAKVPADRVDELIATAGAHRMQMGRGEAREWVGVPPATDGDDALWEQVLAESFAYVAGGA
ncbi:MAG TPA: TfoX/Sxy family protein [Nocardioides sp.]